MLVLLLLHLVGALIAPVPLRWWGPRACYALALVPAAAFGWILAQAPAIRAGRTISEAYPWVPATGVEVALRLESLSWVMALLVTGIGALVLLYSARYFFAEETGLRRFGALFVGFAGAMLGVVVSDSLIVLYVFWELTTVFSYLLIGHIPERRAARGAARQALLVTAFGGLALLVGLLMLGHRAGSYRLSEILTHPPPSSGYLAVALILILLGALSKSAQLPFSFWLPSAMAAPTPVSAYLHAAAMVKAGVYLIGVLAPAFATVGPWRPIVLGVGIITTLVAGWAALRQTDLKLLLAHGTVSQLGLLIAVIGIGTRDAALAGLALVAAHALFKASLFLVVGIIDRQAGHRDIRYLCGLWRRMPALFAVAVLGGASMAGLPPLVGFVAKEATYETFSYGSRLAALVLVGLVAGSALTVAYTARFLWGAFATKGGSLTLRAGLLAPEALVRTEARPPGPAFLTAPAVLAALGVVLAPFAGAVESYLTPYADRAGGPAPAGGTELSGAVALHLKLWYGLTPGLGLSALALLAGLAIFASRRVVGAVEAALRLPRDGVWLFQKITYGVERLAIRVTGATQRGSLPFYVGTVLAVLVVIPGAAALVGSARAGGGLLDRSGEYWPPRVTGWTSPVELAVAAGIIAVAVFTVRSRRRMTAMLFLGLSGYGTALIFVLRGAPDLALTQLLVETVSVLLLVLVFRRLPTHFSEPFWRRSKYRRRTLAALSGAVVALLSVIAVGARQAAPISEQFPAAAAEGGGRNVVDVTLVDLRAWDTMGEISVLVAMATGVASMVFVRPRVRRVPRRGEVRRVGPPLPQPGRRSWLVGARAMMPAQRSIVFEVMTRLIFHTIVLYSVFLVFSGHNRPGGGFTGGLVVGLAVTVRYLAGGGHEIDEAAPVDAGLVLGTGLLLALGTGFGSLLLGNPFLDSAIVDLHLPLVGHIHLATSLFFDIGVYLVVLGLSLDILRSLGSEIDRQLGGVRILPRREAGKA